ncbi:MAG: hypothetical protein WD492_07340 [Alkalispirochaeta sp.]
MASITTPTDTSESGISCSLRSHGATQLQIKVVYPFHNRRSSRFRTDVFVVVPQQISITLDEQGRRSLLEDTRSNTRFTVANMPLSALADQNHPDNPVSRIIAHIENPSKPGKLDTNRIGYEMRTFCNLFTFQLKSLVRVIQQAVRDESGRADGIRAGKDTIRDVKRTLAAFRDLRRSLLDPAVPDEVRSTHILADEFLGDQTVRHLLGLSSILSRESSMEKLHNQIEKMIERELEYQKERGYSAVRSDTTSPDDPRELEKLIVRESRLKKWVQSVLYLDVAESGVPRRVGHIAASLAAATAMSIAVVAAFFADRMYASYSVPWALLIVGSYIVKDRLKEILRSVLVRFFPIAIADRTRILKDPATQRAAGRARLAIRSVDPGDVPPRADVAMHDELLSETVDRSAVVFSSLVRLNGRRLLKSHRRVNGIMDITRIRLDQWLRDMDSPTKGIRLFVGRRPVSTSGPRTYRIQVAVRLVADDGQVDSIKFWTVILTREGILRVES